jgi:hypothetical protein
MWFLFDIRDGTITKAGQFPSLADLAEPSLRRYQSVLGDDKYKELTRGVGLAAHGIGIEPSSISKNLETL